MSSQISCRDIRAALFEIHRGELSNLKRTEVDEHLQECRRCQELVTKTGDMFAAAQDSDEFVDDVDSERIFEEIKKAIDNDAASAASVDPESRLDEAFEIARSADDEVYADFDSDALFEGIEAGLDDTKDLDEPLQDPKLDEMLNAARSADDETWAQFDSDELFDRISQQVDGTSNSEDRRGITQISTKQRSPETEVEASNDRRFGRRRTWVLVAVAACATVVGWWGFSLTDTSSTFDGSERQSEPLATQIDDGAEFDESTTALSDQDISELNTMSLAAMEPVSSKRDSVRLFGSTNVDYEFDDKTHEPSVELHQGSILVEYFPDRDSTFSLRARSHTIEVVGTIFSVAIDGNALQVMVFEGAVEVTAPDGSLRRVEAGEFIAGDERGRLDDRGLGLVDRYVDLAAHRQALLDRSKTSAREAAKDLNIALQARTAATKISEIEQARRQAASQAETPEAQRLQPDIAEPERQTEVAARVDEQESDTSVVDDSTAKSSRKLREMALEALRHQEHRRAVHLLEQALQKTDPSEQASADILLELARIHLRQLDEPRQAADYLRRFVDQWPDDPAADAIRLQLCEMEAVDSADNGLCD